MEIHALQDKILKTVVDELVFNKITHFFSAPGSRSAPLIVNAANHPLLTLHTYFDERGLGFFALGTAKGARAPVCLITTSGSAPANLLPAVIEAYYSEVPLFIITCDRPEPLHEIGSNQTIEQKDIFKPFTAHSCTIRTTELTLSPTAVAGKIAFRARSRSMKSEATRPSSKKTFSSLLPHTHAPSEPRNLPSPPLPSPEKLPSLPIYAAAKIFLSM